VREDKHGIGAKTAVFYLFLEARPTKVKERESESESEREEESNVTSLFRQELR
jgi:hypothetical protein